jgi:hypothetical protein
MGTMRKILMVTVLVGAIATATGSGTFATFNATTTNASGTFQTGTIVLSNKKAAQATCFSYGPGSATAISTNSNACDDMFVFSSNQKPTAGNWATPATLTLQNLGSLPGTLKVGVNAPGSACASLPDTNSSYRGNGDLCSFLKISIQETNTLGGSNKASCVFPVNASAACAATAAGDFSALTSASPLTIGTLDEAGGTTPTRFFTINISFPNGAAGAENSVMGLLANWTLAWVLEQQ